MIAAENKKYFIGSGIFHAVIALILVLNYEFSEPLAVVENTNQHDVISAVVLGDTAKSKILPHEQPTPPPPPKAIEPPKPITPPKVEPKPEPKPEVKPAPKPEEIKKVDDDAIALKAVEKKLAEKKLAEKKMLEKKLADKKAAQDLKKKQQEMFAKDLLADIKKQTDKKQKLKKTALEKDFAKTLKEQAEQSLRQNLMNEDIKMTGKLARQSQGVINKYKALIVQSIGEHWLVPLQANKSLSSELLIRLAPGGMVLDVKVSRSSGDPSLDSSARAAVLKASPLPVPADPGEFEPFRQFVLKVKPENIVEG